MNKTVRIAEIKPNDIVDGYGVCVSVWFQGCPHRCQGCHNPQAWDFNGGIEYNINMLIFEIMKLLEKHGIQRNLSLLGGEPLCPENIECVRRLTQVAKELFPNITIYCWTGYTLEELPKDYLENIDILIDGKFIQEERDITLELRGSPNQRILYKGKDF